MRQNNTLIIRCARNLRERISLNSVWNMAMPLKEFINNGMSSLQSNVYENGSNSASAVPISLKYGRNVAGKAICETLFTTNKYHLIFEVTFVCVKQNSFFCQPQFGTFQNDGMTSCHLISFRWKLCTFLQFRSKSTLDNVLVWSYLCKWYLFVTKMKKNWMWHTKIIPSALHWILLVLCNSHAPYTHTIRMQIHALTLKIGFSTQINDISIN